MPSLTIPNSFSPATVAQSAQVNANFNAVATLLNSTLLANDNIQALGIATSNLAANCVTGAKLNSNVVDNSTLQYSSSQLSIKASGVGTSQLADASVTQAKRAALGQQISSSSSTASTTSNSLVDITNLSISITTTGRPVFIGLVSDGSGTEAHLGTSHTSATLAQAEFVLLRDSTEIARHLLSISHSTSGTLSISIPVSVLAAIDVPGAGTYNYKAQYKAVSSGDSAFASRAKLVAYEL